MHLEHPRVKIDLYWRIGTHDSEIHCRDRTGCHDQHLKHVKRALPERSEVMSCAVALQP